MRERRDKCLRVHPSQALASRGTRTIPFKFFAVTFWLFFALMTVIHRQVLWTISIRIAQTARRSLEASHITRPATRKRSWSTRAHFAKFEKGPLKASSSSWTLRMSRSRSAMRSLPLTRCFFPLTALLSAACGFLRVRFRCPDKMVTNNGRLE